MASVLLHRTAEPVYGTEASELVRGKVALVTGAGGSIGSEIVRQLHRLAAGVYYGLAVWLHWRSRDRWMLLMPFYTLFSSLVLTPIGGWSYLRMVLKHRNAGIIRPQLRSARHAVNWPAA